ncbi:MAG: glycoside hydrolase family 2 TIM barrel-domain containing protein [Kiritimatiellae bacterium]|nr:glycoside hydrolase family 2 TIM barrel-domain containing protein [Kiritimatiellia bacterium]
MSKPVLRQEHDLNGLWSFQIDQDNVGEKKKWFAPKHDRRAWRKVSVPGAWDFYTPELKDYEGVAWYAVELPASMVNQALHQRLIFTAVHNHARVWLNGRFIGEHWGWYMPFVLDFSRAARPGRKQVLVLRVDNMSKKVPVDFLPGTAGPEWVQYGGILQGVKLVSTAKAYLSDLYIHAVPHGAGARIACVVEVTNTGATDFQGRVEVKVAVKGRVFKAAAEIVCRRRSKVRRRLALDLPRVTLWSPDTPALYDARAALVSARGIEDTVADRFGVRTIAVQGTQILLNGRPLVIKGFNRYDELGAYGTTVPEAAIRQDLLLLKRSGANLIRTHYPPSAVNLRLMDEIGLLLLEEIPLNWWIPDTKPGQPLTVRDRRIVRRAEETLAQMVRRDRNHPCLVIWSMSNECGTTTEPGNAAMLRLLRRAKKLDPARLVTFVTDRDLTAQSAFSEADIVCTNTYFGLFTNRALDIDEFKEKTYLPTLEHLGKQVAFWPAKPHLITEWGTHSLPGFHGRHRFTEEYHAEYLRTVWRAIRETPGIAGGVIWCWSDYHHQRDFCPKGYSAMFQAPYGPYGVVSIARKPKAAYWMIRKLWRAAGR